MDALKHDVPSAWHQVLRRLHQSSWAGDLANRIENGGLSYRRIGGRVLNAFSGFTSVVGGLVVVLCLALYFAVDPALYIQGFLKLLPKGGEHRGADLLHLCGGQLRKWLLAKFSLMVFVGIATAGGLRALHFPLVLSLALLAGLLDFIPNVGPILSAIPAVLIAFTHSPREVLWIVALYLAIQVVESYILQPLLQKRAVNLPPSVTLLSQVFLGSLFGPLGLVLATPLTIVGISVVRTIYVQDILGK